MRSMRWFGLLIAAVMLLGTVACKKEGPAEKAGKALDEAAAEAREAAEEAKKKLEE